MATRFIMNYEKKRTIMTEAELDVAHFIYEISNDVYFHRPNDFEKVDQTPEGMIDVHEALMDTGLRFPLHPVISYILVA